MELKKAIGVLETHNRWRRGEEVEPMLKPSDIGNAIDTVVEYVKNNIVLDNVSKPLASKEVKSCMKADLKFGKVCKEPCGASWC